MSRKEIKGIMPPMIAVFKSNEDLDEEGTRAFVNFLIEKGVHGIIPNGSTGEFASLTDEERQRVIQVVVDEANNRVPVYAGISHNSTRLTIEQGRF
ncbi:MAG: dihydrodipicolinate synthase family protein, partial [Candidatus Bathyarchaeota archaeon]|nr:dihydrodipicolinate synthase family protein [Candidatus Bathyarchaeota archaeon]